MFVAINAGVWRTSIEQLGSNNLLIATQEAAEASGSTAARFLLLLLASSVCFSHRSSEPDAANTADQARSGVA
jgi:hypothetical protein